MISNMNLFYKFYQTCEISQVIDLTKSSDEHLIPQNHPDFEKISAAVEDLNNEQPTKTEPSLLARGLYSMKDSPDWFIRKEPKFTKSFSLIKGAPMGPGSSKILRVVMNQRLKQVVRDQKLDNTIPDEYLVFNNPNIKLITEFGYHLKYTDFSVASKKLKILSYENTVKELNNFDPKKQKEIATTICRIIYHSGFMDAHMANIMLTEDKKIAIVDTEAQSLLHDATESYKPISLSQARIVGLNEFISRSKESKLSEVFAQTAKQYLFIAKVMHVVKIATIIFSILLPVIPVVVLVSSVIFAKIRNSSISHPTTEEQIPFRLSIIPATT